MVGLALDLSELHLRAEVLEALRRGESVPVIEQGLVVAQLVAPTDGERLPTAAVTVEARERAAAAFAALRDLPKTGVTREEVTAIIREGRERCLRSS